MINNHWLSITHHNSQPLAQNCTPWLTTTGSALSYAEPVVVPHGVSFGASGWASWFVILSQWLLIMVCDAKPIGCESWCIMQSKVVVNHDVICWAQWLGVMVCYAKPVVVNHGLAYWASGCESGFIMLRKWLWIMVCHAEPMVVNHGELCWASGYESWCEILSQWVWIMDCYALPKVVNHGELCWANGYE
jgi:hypothetical protein